MVLHRKFEKFLRFAEFPRGAVNFAQFVCRVGVAGIDVQFLRELLRRRGYILRGVALPGACQQRSSYPVMNSRSPGIDREHLTIFADGSIIRSLALIGLGLSLMPP